MPRVTVIIPTCNRSAYLKRAIESVCAQTYTDFEIIVVDDASTDDTPEVVAQFADKPIKYIRHEENKGGSVARNTGIKNSQSEYIAFLDDDDEWLPNKLEVQMNVFEQSSPQVGPIYSGHSVIDRNTGKTKGIWRAVKRGNIFEELMKGNCVSTTSSVVVKRACLEKVGNFDSLLPSFQDYDLWIRIARHYEFEYVEDLLVNYYEHEKKIWTNYEAIENGIAMMVERHGHSRELRKTFSYAYLGLGVRRMMNGAMQQGRALLQKAMKLYPFEIRHYLNFVVSLLGHENFRKSHRMKGVCTEWFKKG